MLLLHRYVLREVVQTFAAVLVVLLLIYLSTRFVRFLTEAAAGRIAGDLIASLLLLKLGAQSAVLLPLAGFGAVLLALGRLYRDSEVVAMRASGLGLRSLTRAVLGFALVLAALTAALSVVVSPRLAGLQEQVLARARGEAEITGIVPGRFREFGGARQVFYVESLAPDRRGMRRVFVHLSRGGREEVLVAERAYQTVRGREGDRFIVLEDGVRYSGTPGRSDFAITRFERHAVRVDRIGHIEVGNPLEARTTVELWRTGGGPALAELEWRLSLPLSALVLAALAVPLARTTPRQGRYGRLFVAIVAYFAYSNALGIARKLVESGDLPAAVGVWPVHAVVALVAAGLVARQSGVRLAGTRGPRGPTVA